MIFLWLNDLTVYLSLKETNQYMVLILFLKNIWVNWKTFYVMYQHRHFECLRCIVHKLSNFFQTSFHTYICKIIWLILIHIAHWNDIWNNRCMLNFKTNMFWIMLFDKAFQCKTYYCQFLWNAKLAYIQNSNIWTYFQIILPFFK